MSKYLKKAYLLRPEEIVYMLMNSWRHGYLMAVLEEELGCPDDDPHLFGSETQAKAWAIEEAKRLLKLRKRKDGTYYSPGA